MEELLAEIIDKSDGDTECERSDDLNKRVDEHRKDIYLALFECLGDAERDSKNDKSHDIVERDYGKQQSSQRTVSLVLLDDHQRRGGSRCGRDSSEGENAGERKLVGNN